MELDDKNYLVVGYRGEIGSHILGGLIKFLPSATKIWCFDACETEEDKIERIKKSDVIFLCVPFDKTLFWISNYIGLLDNKTIVEQCSWKSDIKNFCDQHEEIIIKRNIKILHMHILYKPSITLPEDREVLIFDDLTGKQSWFEVFSVSKNIRDFIEQGLNAKYTEFDGFISTHDNAMARQQCDLYNMIETFIDKYENEFKNIEFTTRNFKKIKELYNRIKQMNPGLRISIDGNPYKTEKRSK